MAEVDHANSLRKREWAVSEVAAADAKNLVRLYHYAKGSSHTCVYSHGLYQRSTPERLRGAALWLPPTRRAAETVASDDWRRVLALSRLVCTPDAPKNAASFLLARAVDSIHRDGRFTTLVTYADERMGHTGAIYRAANWQYLGQTRATPAWVDPRTGRQVASQATRTRTAAQMRALGYVCVGAYRKHKYVLRLTTRHRNAPNMETI